MNWCNYLDLTISNFMTIVTIKGNSAQIPQTLKGNYYKGNNNSTF